MRNVFTMHPHYADSLTLVHHIAIRTGYLLWLESQSFMPFNAMRTPQAAGHKQHPNNIDNYQ